MRTDINFVLETIVVKSKETTIVPCIINQELLKEMMEKDEVAQAYIKCVEPCFPLIHYCYNFPEPF